jgi:hypothetical protein
VTPDTEVSVLIVFALHTPPWGWDGLWINQLIKLSLKPTSPQGASSQGASSQGASPQRICCLHRNCLSYVSNPYSRRCRSPRLNVQKRRGAPRALLWSIPFTGIRSHSCGRVVDHLDQDTVLLHTSSVVRLAAGSAHVHKVAGGKFADNNGEQLRAAPQTSRIAWGD